MLYDIEHNGFIEQGQIEHGNVLIMTDLMKNSKKKFEILKEFDYK